MKVPECGRPMVGSGTDTYDPVCELPAGHSPPCRSTAAVDQHRCTQRETARAQQVDVNQVWRRKRKGESHATVTIQNMWLARGGILMLDVTRNTSRRRQAISLDTLLRDYKREVEVPW